MINKKGVVLVFIVLTLFLSVTGCNNNKDVAVNDNPGGGINVSKTKSFASVKELKESAEEIVRLKVLSSETVKHEEMHFTVSKAEVLKVYKGNLVEGNIINLTQTGAVVDGQDISIAGDPIYIPDDEMILFLKKYVGLLWKMHILL
ncbi:MAG: hypothetical protein ACOYWZ_00370 [Bacillota bacterium]